MAAQTVLDQYRDAEFQWGQLDCCLFVADVLKATTGRDYAARWRGTYDCEFGALRIVRRHGGLNGIAAMAWGEMLPASAARDGDPVLFGGKYVERDSIGKALGICHGDRIYYLTKRGLATAPLNAAEGCWHVETDRV